MPFLLTVSDAKREKFQFYGYFLPNQLEPSRLCGFLAWWLWTQFTSKLEKNSIHILSSAMRYASSMDSMIWLLAQCLGTVPLMLWSRRNCICFLHLYLPSTIKSKSATDFYLKAWRWHRCTSNNLRFQDVILGAYLPFTIDRSWAISYLPKSSNKNIFWIYVKPHK